MSRDQVVKNLYADGYKETVFNDSYEIWEQGESTFLLLKLKDGQVRVFVEAEDLSSEE